MQRFPGGNYSIIPKSVDTVRIAANIAITDFILDVSEMDYIKSLEAGKRCCDPMTFWGIPYFEWYFHSEMNYIDVINNMKFLSNPYGHLDQSPTLIEFF